MAEFTEEEKRRVSVLSIVGGDGKSVLCFALQFFNGLVVKTEGCFTTESRERKKELRQGIDEVLSLLESRGLKVEDRRVKKGELT
jgi:hypothetical protein